MQVGVPGGRPEQLAHRGSFVEEQPAVPGRDAGAQRAAQVCERGVRIPVAMVRERAHQQGLDEAATTIGGFGGGHDPVQQCERVLQGVRAGWVRCCAMSRRARVSWSYSAR